MGKIVNTDTVVEWVQSWFIKDKYYHPYSKQSNIPISELYDILEQMPSAQPEPTLEQIEEYCRKRCLVIMTSELYNYMTSRWSSAQPERKKGEWIDTGSGQECSVCGEIQYGYDNFRRFCPKCGAKMEGEEHESC